MQTSSAPTEKGKTMTALEYMENQLQKQKYIYGREMLRCVPQEMLDNIKRKISYYEEAVETLKNEEKRKNLRITDE